MKNKLRNIGIVISSSLLFFGCGKIEPQIGKLRELITKDSSAIAEEKAIYEMAITEPITPNALPAEQAANSLIFSCFTKNDKAIKVYAKGGLIYYEFGAPDSAPEMSLSMTPEKADISLWSGVGRYESYSIRFFNGNTSYSVFWSQDKLSAASSIEAGVNVERGGSPIATVNCGNQASIFYDADKLIEQTANFNSTAGIKKAKTLEESPYRKPNFIFKASDLFEKMRAKGVDGFYIEGIKSYLETPKTYWGNCVSGYAEESKQSGGYGEAEAKKYGEQVCNNKANALYACLNDVPIKSAASCLKKDIEEEEDEGGGGANASVSTPVISPAPNVDACVEQRINEFRKEHGEEPVIKYYVIEEWETECKTLVR